MLKENLIYIKSRYVHAHSQNAYLKIIQLELSESAKRGKLSRQKAIWACYY